MNEAVFSCNCNSGRFKLSAALLNQMVKDNGLSYSIGKSPASRINPAVLEVMREASIDISNRESTLLTLEIFEYADRLITTSYSDDWGT